MDKKNRLYVTPHDNLYDSKNWYKPKKIKKYLINRILLINQRQVNFYAARIIKIYNITPNQYMQHISLL